jgi:hypothetical protein
MKRIFGIVSIALLAGCAVPRESASLEDVQPGDPDISETPFDQIRQSAQFADDSVLNLVDFAANPVITLTADFNPITVNVYYCSGKTTDSGSVPGIFYLRQTLELNGDQTRQHTVALGHTAFTGGYGCVFLDSPGGGPFDVFQAHVVSPEGGIQSVGGSVFQGGSFRIPYLGASSKMVLAITSQAAFDFDVEITKVGTATQKTITLPPLSTYKFDSSAYGWNLGSSPNSVQVFTTNGGVVALSGYAMKGTTKYRLAPVKAAPYF